MNNRSSIRFYEIAVTAAFLVGIAHQTACFTRGGQSQQGGTPENNGANDQKLMERMEKMRARALNAPGSTLEASDFAFQVTLLYSQGVVKRQEVPPTLVDEAVRCLDQARLAKPDDAADLLARKGEMLIAAGRNEAGIGALRGSIAERPTLRAFTPLIKLYNTQKMIPETEALCKRTLPAMKSDESRYAVLDECLKSNGAATPEAGLRWASSKDVSFYKARRRELEARLAAAKQQKTKEEHKDGQKH